MQKSMEWTLTLHLPIPKISMPPQNLFQGLTLKNLFDIINAALEN